MRLVYSAQNGFTSLQIVLGRNTLVSAFAVYTVYKKICIRYIQQDSSS